MNRDKQIVALAELEGFTDYKPAYWDHEKQDWYFPPTGTGKVTMVWPATQIRTEYFPYLEDRDAIMKLVALLPEGNMVSSNPSAFPRWTFSRHLLRIMNLQLCDNGTSIPAPVDIGWTLIQATPEQIAEALLKTIRKWEE